MTTTDDLAPRVAAGVERLVADWQVLVVESEHDPGCPGGGDYCESHCPVPVQRFLTDDEVRAHLAAVLREGEAGVRAAALEDAAEAWTPASFPTSIRAWLRDRAAREREATR